jgi:hypothetical protein
MLGDNPAFEYSSTWRRQIPNGMCADPFEAARRSRRLSRGPQSIATVGTGVIRLEFPPYMGVIRLLIRIARRTLDSRILVGRLVLTLAELAPANPYSKLLPFEALPFEALPSRRFGNPRFAPRIRG